MARGSIRKVARKDGVSYEVVVDLGDDPISGKRRQRTRRFRTKREAQAGLTEWLAEIDKGLAIDRSAQTVADVLTYWLEAYAKHNVRPTTLDQYTNTIENHIIPTLGHIPAQRLTPTHLQTFYANKLSSGCSERVVQLCHLRLHQALEMAQKLGLVSRNVADAVIPPRVPQGEMLTWTAEEARRFLVVAAQSAYGPIWMVFLATGMRRGEVLGLRWQDVEWEQHLLRIRQSVTVVRGRTIIQQPKSRSAVRSVPVPDSVMAVLREHQAKQNERCRRLGALWQDHDLIFASEVGTPISPRNINREFDRWVKRTRVPRIRVHDIRHTVVTLALAAGSSIKAVSEHVGHAQTSITMDIYAHVLPQQRLEVAQRIGEAVFGEAASRSTPVPE